MFKWSEEYENHFKEVKIVLSSLPTISPPNWDDIFYVNPSVGTYTLGVVLMQKDPKTLHMRPIYFASRVMNLAEKSYIAIEQMVLSLIFALKKFHPYLLPKQFVVITVENTFPYVMQHMDSSARIAKWVVQIQEYDYTFIVEDSTRACLADVLTHRCHERRIVAKPREGIPPVPQEDLENAYTLHCDMAFRMRTGKVVGASLSKTLYKEL